MNIEMIPLNTLKPSPANPRKAFDEDEIASLAQSIKTDGLLQNLVVLKRTFRKNDTYTIISGERRYRALQSLVKTNDLPKDMSVPAEVKTGLSDEEALRLATVENIQREDLSPLEEAEALKVLSRGGDAIDTLSAQTGLGVTTIRRRLILLNLCGEAQQQLQQNQINLSQAEALSLASHKEQERLLRSIENGYVRSAEQIRDRIFDSKPTIACAIFDTTKYTGTISRDLLSDAETSYFDDREQFDELQRQAAEALTDKYENSHEWAELVEGYFYSHEYEKASKGTKGGVIICLRSSGEVEVHKGLIKALVHETVKEKRIQPTYSKPLCRYMAMHKSMAVQVELISDARKAKEVLVCAMLANLNPHACLSYLADSGSPAYAAVETEAKAVLELLGHESDDTAWDSLEYLFDYAAQAYDVVSSLNDNDLERVLVLLTAMQTGQGCLDRLDTDKDSLINRVADDLKTDMRQHWTPDSDFLSRRKKDQLATIIKQAGATNKFASLHNYKKSEIVIRLERFFLEARQSEKPNRDQKKALKWLPEAMRFPAINPDAEST